MARESTAARGQFFTAFGVCLAVMAVASFVVGRLTAHTVSKRVLAEAASTASETIALGNSLMRSGFLADAFAPPASPGERPRAVNLAMGASGPTEHLLLLRAALGADANARVVLYGFYDFQLTEPEAFAASDLIGNHDMLYYQEPEFARRFYRMSPRDAAAFEIGRRLPLFSERGAVWAKVEVLRRALAQQGMPRVASGRFGRAADFTLLEAKSREEFERHCLAALASPLNEPVSEMLREAGQRGVRVTVVLMPLPPKHVGLFYDTAAWSAYERHLRILLAARGAAYLDASRWIPEGQRFGDALHLGDEGGREFSRRLGQWCAGPSGSCRQ